MTDPSRDNPASLRRALPDAPRRVLLVGWDAADWQMINPLIQRGEMPTLASMMQRGAWGNLASMQPMLSPMLWNSIATGKRPDQHGICGFTEPDPDSGGVRPVASTSRRCKALWNILTQCDMRSVVVGWYASHPAEPISGAMVSNQFDQLVVRDGELVPAPAHSVHPPGLAAEMEEFRVRPDEIDASAVLPFIPDAQRLMSIEGNRIGPLRRMIAQTATIHAAATRLLAGDDWDLGAVYYEGIDRFGHEFMEFHPPKMDAVSQEDFEAYQACMVGIYRFHDMMLQALLGLVGDDTAVVLLSDHGYYSDHLRPDPTDTALSPAAWHRPFGVYAAAGPGIQPGTRAYGANLLDIAPTVLQLLGLPAGADMPGRVLSETLTQPDPIDRVMTWDGLEGECGMHPASFRVDPVEAKESLQQLIDLGYIEAPSDDEAKAARDAEFWNTLNLAQSLSHAGRFRQALGALGSIEDERRDLTPVRLLAASCMLGTGDTAAARAELEALRTQTPDHIRVRFMLGVLEQTDGNDDLALEHFRAVERAAPRLPGLHTKLGAVYLGAGRHDDARTAYQAALGIDPENPMARLGLARVDLACGDPAGALDHAMHATALTHHLPAGHFVIARALIGLNRPEDAAQALCVCIAQAPQMPGAYDLLAKIYRSLGRTDDAIETALRAAAPS